MIDVGYIGKSHVCLHRLIAISLKAYYATCVSTAAHAYCSNDNMLTTNRAHNSIFLLRTMNSSNYNMYSEYNGSKLRR
jgi:hypothetical protein